MPFLVSICEKTGVLRHLLVILMVSLGGLQAAQGYATKPKATQAVSSFARSLLEFQAYSQRKQVEARAYAKKRYPGLNQSPDRQRLLDRAHQSGNSPLLLHHGGATRVSALLVHGFSDSPYFMEHIAQHLYSQGVNVVVVLLTGHGLESDALADSGVVTLKAWQKDVDAGFRIAKGLGDKVVGVGFSTGASLLLESASYTQIPIEMALLGDPMMVALPFPQPDGLIVPPRLKFDGLVLFAPVLRVLDWRVRTLGPSGMWIYKQVSDYSFPPEGDDWSFKYLKKAINGVEQVQRLVNHLVRFSHWDPKGSGSRPPMLGIFSEADDTIDTQFAINYLSSQAQEARSDFETYVFASPEAVDHTGFIRFQQEGDEFSFIDHARYQKMTDFIDRFLDDHGLSVSIEY